MELHCCSVSRLALHRAAMPNIFLSCFYFFLLVYFRRLNTLLPPLCVIVVFTMCNRVLLLYVSKITHTYFYFIDSGWKVFIFVFLWWLVDRIAIPSIRLVVCCFRPCDVCSALIYLDMCSDLVRGDACSILLPTMRSEIFSSFFVDRRGGRRCSGCLSFLFRC